jgi:hypothetical protein
MKGVLLGIVKSEPALAVGVVLPVAVFTEQLPLVLLRNQ